MPRILACGHIYCFPCLVQFYFRCKDRCCICDTKICILDSKRLIVQQHLFKKGKKVEFVLGAQVFKNGLDFYSFDWVRKENKSEGNFLNHFWGLEFPEDEARLEQEQNSAIGFVKNDKDILHLNGSNFVEKGPLSRQKLDYMTSKDLENILVNDISTLHGDSEKVKGHIRYL